MDDEIEHTLYVNREVKLYRIPPRPGSTGHMSGNWRVADQIFTGRLRLIAKGAKAEIRLEDSSTGDLFALCPFTPANQSVTIEATVDSSRYFVLRVEDPATGRHAFVGLGFSERGEAFDFNAALADYAKQCKRDEIVYQAAAAAVQSSQTGVSSTAVQGASLSTQDPAVAALYKDPGDLSLKEGQTIRIDVRRNRSQPGGFLSRAAGGPGSFRGASLHGGSSQSGGLLPPPILPPPPGGQQSFSGGMFSPATAAQQEKTRQPSGNAVTAPSAVAVAATEDNWATFD